ncbi:hypothetical protein D3C77_374460 [compost metagenome]
MLHASRVGVSRRAANHIVLDSILRTVCKYSARKAIEAIIDITGFIPFGVYRLFHIPFLVICVLEKSVIHLLLN